MTEKKETKQSIYQTLSKIDVSPYIDKKMGLNYVSWAKAWGLIKAIYPETTKKITEYPEYLPTKDGKWVATGRTVDYRLTPFGCEVEVTVNIQDNLYSSNLFVMNYKNKAVKNPRDLDFAQINKTQQRCLVKALATAGLGLNVYAGEDLPSGDDEPKKPVRKPSKTHRQRSPRQNNVDPDVQSMIDQADPESFQTKAANARKFKIQYGGGKELLIDVISWALNGDQQAKDFLDAWTNRDKKNLNAYKFIRNNFFSGSPKKVSA